MFRLHRFVHSSRTVQLVCCAFLLLGSGCTNSLNRAISREHPEAIQKFLKAGADVNERDDDGCTPLIYAAQSGDLALIKILVERGATVNSVDNGGGSALGYLVSREHHKNAEIAFLLARGADVNHANKETLTPLHLAVMQSCPPEEAAQQTELVMALLYAGADANRRTQNGELPLHLAAAVGQPDQVLEQLLHATKQPDALAHPGYSALSEAARGGWHEAALFLVRHDFKPQELLPASPPVAAYSPAPIIVEPVFPTNARAYEAMGDCLFGQGELTNALDNYRKSAANYEAAAANCQQAVNLSALALKEAKEGRRSRWISTVALNIVGGGLAAATGVGFAVAPKPVKNNHIDEFTEELARDNAELAKITRDQSNLSTKIQDTEHKLKTEEGKSPVPVAQVAASPMPATAP